jgi:urate oxidase
VSDRIFSTEIDLVYEFHGLPENIAVDGFEKLEKDMAFRDTAAKAREITLEVFATDDSASVQATLFKTAQALIAASSTVSTVQMSLPNKHYVPVDLGYIGLENVKPPEKAEVFCPIAAPSGLITATVSRSRE